MVSVHQWFIGRVDFWTHAPCPFCGYVGIPGSLSIFNTTSINCGSCKAAMEGFELYDDGHGHAQVENHYLYDKLGSYPYRRLRDRRRAAEA